jgi:hypothetical protein
MKFESWLFLSIVSILVAVLTGCVSPASNTATESNPPLSSAVPSPVSSVISPSPSASTPAPASSKPSTSPSPTSKEIQTIVIDKPVPASYTTYTDPNGLFKISYPDNFEIFKNEKQLFAECSDQVSRYLNKSLRPDSRGFWLFAADTHKPFAGISLNFYPWESNPTPYYNDYFEGVTATVYKTTVGGYDAIMVEEKQFFTEIGMVRSLTLQIVKNQNAWHLLCCSLPEEYNNWADDFKSILGSLRILK